PRSRTPPATSAPAPHARRRATGGPARRRRRAGTTGRACPRGRIRRGAAATDTRDRPPRVAPPRRREPVPRRPAAASTTPTAANSATPPPPRRIHRSRPATRRPGPRGETAAGTARRRHCARARPTAGRGPGVPRPSCALARRRDDEFTDLRDELVRGDAEGLAQAEAALDPNPGALDQADERLGDPFPA